MNTKRVVSTMASLSMLSMGTPIGSMLGGVGNNAYDIHKHEKLNLKGMSSEELGTVGKKKTRRQRKNASKRKKN